MPSLFPPFRLTGPSPRHPPLGRSGTPSPPHFPSFLLLPPAVHETAMLLKSFPKRRRLWPCARGRPRGRGDRTRGHTVPGTRPNRSLGSKLSPDLVSGSPGVPGPLLSPPSAEGVHRSSLSQSPPPLFPCVPARVVKIESTLPTKEGGSRGA